MNIVGKIALKSPICLGRHFGMTLDAVMGGIAWERTQSVDAVNALPIICHDELYMASSLILEMPFIKKHTSFIQSFAKDVMLDRARFDFINAGKKIDHKGGKNKNIQTSYDVFETPSVWFICQTVEEDIRSFFSDVHAIGALRNKGYGEIDYIEINTVETNEKYFGAVDTNGMAARPIPATYGIGKSDFTLLTSWQNPYRSSKKEICLMPPTMAMTYQDIIEWSGQ